MHYYSIQLKPVKYQGDIKDHKPYTCETVVAALTYIACSQRTIYSELAVDTRLYQRYDSIFISSRNKLPVNEIRKYKWKFDGYKKYEEFIDSIVEVEQEQTPMNKDSRQFTFQPDGYTSYRVYTVNDMFRNWEIKYKQLSLNIDYVKRKVAIKKTA